MLKRRINLSNVYGQAKDTFETLCYFDCPFLRRATDGKVMCLLLKKELNPIFRLPFLNKAIC